MSLNKKVGIMVSWEKTSINKNPLNIIKTALNSMT